METNFRIDEYKDRKFAVETSIIPGVESHGTATIFGSFRNVAWGELVCGQAVNYHIFNLVTDKKGKVSECVIIPQHYENKQGKFQELGTREQVQRAFEIMQGQMIDAKNQKEIDDQKKQSLAQMVEEKARKGEIIRAKRAKLRSELQKLAEGKSIDEQLSDKDLQKLAVELSVFNLLYPERIKI